MPRAEQQQPLLAAQQRRPDSYLFPRWWFVVMALPNILPGLVGTAFGSIVWPLAVAKLAGFQDKALVFALCAQVGVVMSWSAPFIGVWSDKTPPWIARRFGRRRPFIFVGGLSFWLGNLLNYIAIRGLSEPSPVLLGVGLVTMNLGGCISGPAFNAIVPETVPLPQRGLSITVQAWLTYICALLGNGVGWMLGEQTFPWLTDDLIWRANIAMVGLQVPLQLIACNGTAGWWRPEHSATELQPAPPPTRDAATATVGESGCGRSMVAAVREFIGSFRYPTYRWYWVFCAINTLANIIDTSFTFFWLQDCFTEFRFFGVSVATNVKSAVALQGMVISFLPIFTISLLQPQKWRERHGGRQVMLWSTALLYFVRPFSFVIWQGEFTLVLLWTIFQVQIQ